MQIGGPAPLSACYQVGQEGLPRWGGGWLSQIVSVPGILLVQWRSVRLGQPSRSSLAIPGNPAVYLGHLPRCIKQKATTVWQETQPIWLVVGRTRSSVRVEAGAVCPSHLADLCASL